MTATIQRRIYVVLAEEASQFHQHKWNVAAFTSQDEAQEHASILKHIADTTSYYWESQPHHYVLPLILNGEFE